MEKFLVCFLLWASSASSALGQTRVIFDSDMGPDYDDVGAITMLHTYADSGLVRILATVASTRYPGVGGVMSVFNTYFHRPSIPIGIAGPGGLLLRDGQHWSDTLLARYPHDSSFGDAVSVYRASLVAQPDSSVTVVTVGFLTNLSRLLSSPPDGVSSLTGLELVRRKVRLLVSMAGRFPSGYEFNVMKDAPASAFVFDHWPTPIVFSGFEVGASILAGIPLIHDPAIQHSPVKDVFRISIPLAPEDSAGRKSWDETAVLVAVKGVAPFFKLEYGHMVVAPDGRDTWTPGPGTQARIVFVRPPAEVSALINRLILR
jgi:inosine-uridine nucleoside N-ribohydrolase